MRDLRECQAEVFRRSEKRIKARKRRRNRILMACLPVALGISLFSAFVLPNMTPAGSDDFAEPEMYVSSLPQDMYGSHSCRISEITVVGSGFSKTHTDTAQVLLISDQLFDYETRGFRDGNCTDGEVIYKGENPENISSVIADSATAGYTITLVMYEGENSQYRLIGNTLKSLLTDRTHTLTQIQVYELYDLLGIPY